MRGFGHSTPMPRDFPWTLDIVIDDYSTLMDALGIERFHLVGAKIGGVIGRAFAAADTRGQFHLAATDPDRCAAALLAFLGRYVISAR